MRTLGLVLAMVLTLGVGCFAETATFDVYSDWNLISTPLVPLDSAVDNVFSDAAGGTAFDMMFTVTFQKWDAANQSYATYDAFDPSTFGGVLLGDGYWFNDPTGGTVAYEGIADGVPSAGVKTDMWISLPGNQGDGVDAGGWQLIGNPFNHDVCVDPNYNYNGEGVKFTDGVDVKIWSEAVDAGWVDPGMLYWVNNGGYYQTMGYFFNDDDSLRAGKGYWLRTYKDNLAMIVPGN